MIKRKIVMGRAPDGGLILMPEKGAQRPVHIPSSQVSGFVQDILRTVAGPVATEPGFVGWACPPEVVVPQQSN